MALKECKVCGKTFDDDLVHFVPISRESKKLSCLCWACHTKKKGSKAVFARRQRIKRVRANKLLAIQEKNRILAGLK
jgi:5-methylcytosine-specific restriction endonuclease McrA